MNFCLVPLSPSSSKWSTSTTVRGEQGEADWAGSREVGGGGGGEHLTQTSFVLGAGVCNTIAIEEGWGGSEMGGA